MGVSLMSVAFSVSSMYLVSALLEYLLPDGGVKGSASKAIGLILLACVAQAVLEAVWRI